MLHRGNPIRKVEYNIIIKVVEGVVRSWSALSISIEDSIEGLEVLGGEGLKSTADRLVVISE